VLIKKKENLTEEVESPQIPEEKKPLIKVIKEAVQKRLKSIDKKLVLSLLKIVFFIIVLIILFIFVRKFFLTKKPQLPPPVSPVPTKPEEIASPSAYATASAVLKIEQDLKEVEELLKTTKFKEPSLLPPSLDMKVEFKIKD
jgi:cytoskeletal protein RodZ